jgi:hypothetical protein
LNYHFHLASIYHHQKRYQKAEIMLRVIEAKRDFLGLQYHLDLVFDLKSLFDMYNDHGYFDKVEAILTQLKEYCKGRNGDLPRRIDQARLIDQLGPEILQEGQNL